MPKAEHWIPKDPDQKDLTYCQNTPLLPGTFLWTFTAVNCGLVWIVTSLGSGIWKSLRVFCRTVSPSAYDSVYSTDVTGRRKTLLLTGRWGPPESPSRRETHPLGYSAGSTFWRCSEPQRPRELLFLLYCYTTQALLVFTPRQQNGMTCVTNHLLQLLSFPLCL